MQHTIVAVFERRTDAQHSIDDLLDAGFARTAMRLSEGDPLGPDLAREGEESFIDTIRRYFVDLFGADSHDDAHLYSEAVQSGHFVLTLRVDDEEEADRAAVIVERYRPLNMDDYDSERRGPVRAHASGQFQGSTGNVQRAGDAGLPADAGAQQIAQPPADPGIAPRSVKVFSRTLLGGVDPADLPALADPLAERDDDAAFRAHWRREYADAGGSYDELAPAYRFGAASASSGTISGIAWDEVKETLHRDWLHAHPDQRWEQVEAAVRHGWERVVS